MEIMVRSFHVIKWTSRRRCIHQCWVDFWLVPLSARLMQEPQNEFPQNLDGGWVSAQNRPYYLLVRIRTKDYF